MLFFRKHGILIGIIICFIMLVFMVLGIFSIDESTNAMITGYLNYLGYEVGDKPLEITRVTIPQDFDAIYSSYNKIQLEAGFDLSKYKGKSLSKYSYEVKNLDGEGVRANVLVYDGIIVGGDISSPKTDGFLKSLSPNNIISHILRFFHPFFI